MIVKEPILKQRVRKIPRSFSWVDHRLVRDRHMESCTHAQSALYLLLVCVSDTRGLSYYSDKSIMKKLDMDVQILREARTDLVKHSLIAWQKPIYQVLSLEPRVNNCRSGQMMNLSMVLHGRLCGRVERCRFIFLRKTLDINRYSGSFFCILRI
jgi:hypothetical protein